MTEEEARIKWCPHARIRYSGSNEPACNMRHNCKGGTEREKCIASSCMMWKPYDIASLSGGYCGLSK